MTGDSVFSRESGGAPGTAAPTGTAAVVERAKGALMALTGCSPEAAHEDLLRRAKAAHRTLTEECWIALGTLVPPLSHAAGSATADEEAEGAVLAGLGRALTHVETPPDLARCLLAHLAGPVGADAVLIHRCPPSGEPVLIGYADTDGTRARRWRDVPPPAGTGGTGERSVRAPRRTEHTVWLPVAGTDGAEVVVGVLRERADPFTPRTRELLRHVSWLCAGRLRDLGAGQGRPGSSGAPRPPVPAPASLPVDGLFAALPGAVLLLSPLRSPSGDVEDYRVDAATAQSADVLGLDAGDLVGRRLLECRPDAAGEPLWQSWLAALDTGEPRESEPFTRRAPEPGTDRREPPQYVVRAVPLGDALVVSWLRHDASDRQAQRLAELQRLGRLGWAVWDLVTHEAAWSDQVHLLLDRDPALGPVPVELLPDLAVPEDGPALGRAVRELLRDGTPFDVPFRVRTTAGLRHLRAVAETVVDTAGRPVEVHGFVQDLTAQRSAELALVESERTMLAQDGVLRAERMLAGRLQHALLPLPRHAVRLAGLRVDVTYLPAESGIHVGGDWFSAVELPDGDALFVVGDVAGHGIDAVATMAQLRFTAKGMIFTGSSLTGALARLNTLLLHSRDTKGTATLVLARYEPRERRLVWAQAGHLPPLLLRRGEPRYLERPFGVLLGATETPVYAEAECRLEPGDRLLFYTDGLVERPGENIQRGLERLARNAAAHHADAPGSLVPLLGSMLEGERRDDVCVLDVRVPGEPA
ncbi:SpoIIE family protein phosphatase [Streptomyces sp. NPDC059631]|uniref:SpoIIE family protein phosphatase n=1 Tax=unclassified Streptomyces TaxID=2593676 RepID=UPI0036753A33